MHANEPETVVLSKTRPQTAGPRRPPTAADDNNGENKAPETAKIDVSMRVAQARVAQGFKTRKDLAKALSISVNVINCIESRKGKLDKHLLNKTCQFLKIKTTP